MKFVLFRHAQKGVTPFDDPELTLKGFEQAALILHFVKEAKIPSPTQLLVSPRRRTSQTLYALTKDSRLHLTVKIELDQRQQSESSTEFRQRINLFLKNLASEYKVDDCVFACTHYDWIDEAMSLIDCNRDLGTFEFSHWAPAQYVIFDITNDRWTFLEKGEAR